MKTKSFPKVCLFSWETGWRLEWNPAVAPQIPVPGMPCVTRGPGAEWGQGLSLLFQGLFICFEEERIAGCGFCNKGEGGKHPGMVLMGEEKHPEIRGEGDSVIPGGTSWALDAGDPQK